VRPTGSSRSPTTRDAPNLAISTHSSASADRYLERVVDLFADNLGRFVRGEPLRNVVDLTGGY
jgi:phosphoglycerate dehydrogenase-like enzyme